MASHRLKVKLVLVLLVLCSLAMEEAYVAGCNIKGNRCLFAKAASQEIHNRKLLLGVETKPKEGSNVDLHGTSSTTGNGGKMEGLAWELRKVPSGPDPLHHNGSGSKKPRTP